MKVLLLVLGLSALVWAQDGPTQSGSATVARPRPKPGSTTNTPDAQPATPAPADDTQAAIPSKLSPKATKDKSEQADATFTAESNVVTVDVAVLDNKGNPIPGLTKDKFRILEDNVPQTVSQFDVGEAPMTIALVIEFSNRFQQIYSRGWFETLNDVYLFSQMLKPDDYAAVIAFDLKAEILTDFTNDRAKLQEALARLRVAGFSESNMFDALTDTADRMSKIEGRKAILYIGSGIDTFSRMTYDKTRKSLQESGVPVYSVGTLQVARMMAESSGMMGAIANLDFLQADNELRTFAKETGGQAFFPRFLQEMPQVFNSLTKSLRSEYTLGYSSNNQARDGKFRRISVQLVDPETGQPVRMTDEKGKPFKYTIVAKAGYTAPRAVE
jgi:VWFA-related protein